jgi:hypothetical protein
LRSTIEFPYSSLKDAEVIAEELHSSWGGSARSDQLAAGLGSSPKSGAFRTKIATARTFGATSTVRGSISLTEIGRQLIDPQTRDAARVRAFMSVPLFAALVKEYEGSMLPSDSGLEQIISELGVSVKQATRARQAFQRSAEQAGFFRHGRQRLVPPADQTVTARRDTARRNEDEPRGGDPVGSASRTNAVPAPLIDLWTTLLDEGADWSAEKVQQYVSAARMLRGALVKDS